MTKEHLIENFDALFETGHISDCLDEFAKQKAIDFAEWSDVEGWSRPVNSFYWINQDRMEQLTTDQLFTLYLDSLINNKS